MFSIRIYSLFFFLFSCTGLNLRVPITTNTHPIPEYATIYSFFKGGLFFHRASLVRQVANANSEREGASCSYSILYLVGYGDSSIHSAKIDGGVSRIGHIEERITAILGSVYHSHCTIVRGE